MATRSFFPPRQAGISLIEMMVGVVIGLIAVLVIYQTFATAEAFKRQTISAGDAQQNGLFTVFTLGVELGNAGSGLMNNLTDLANCPDTKDIKTTLRPIPVLIMPGADDATPDSFVVNYSTATTVVAPSLFKKNAASGTSTITVQSPNGFAKGDVAIAMTGAGACETVEVKSAPVGPDGNGLVDIPLVAALTNNFTASNKIVNVGPATSVQRVLYDVSNGVLRSTDQLVAGATPNPIASSIVNMKVLYGIDATATPDQFMDTWVTPTGAWAPDAVLAATPVQLARLKAIRIGVVVRSDEYDRDAPAFDWTLFNCTTEEKKLYTCPPAITGTAPANYRYRVYETVVPLRNSMWNKP